MRKIAARQHLVVAGLVLPTIFSIHTLWHRSSTLSIPFLVSPNGCGSARHMRRIDRYGGVKGNANRVALHAVATTGSLCKIKLEGKLSTDSKFVATDGEDMDMTVGYKHILEGLDKHIVGMNIGQTKNVRISSVEANGPLLDNLVLNIPADELPAGIEKGTNVPIATDKSAIVTGVDNKFVTLAFEHPWAGKDLDLKVTLLSAHAPPDIQYIDVSTVWPGDSKNYPRRGDKVTLHFEMINSQTREVIESSRMDGTPLSFTIGEGDIDPSWDEALMRVSHGEIAKIRIPSTMTAGAETDDDTVMKVELLEINGKKFDTKMRDMSKARKLGPVYVFGSSSSETF